LGRSPHNEAFLAAHGLSVWSADFAADDWTHISAQKVLDRALKRLDRKGKGILLLHDIQPATALALPRLLRELKGRGYRVVHVVPRGPARPKPQPQGAPDQIVMDMPRRPAWPTVNEAAPLQLPYARAEDLHWPQRLAMTYAAHPVEIPLAEPLVAWPVEPDAAFTWPAVEPDGSKRSEIDVEPDPVNFGFASMPGEITSAPLPAIAAGFAPSGGKPAEMVYPVFALEPLLKVQAAQNH
jgi:hypothetical protein